MLSLSSPQSAVLLTSSQSTTPLAVPDDCDDIGLLLRSVPQSCIGNFSPTCKYSICVVVLNSLVDTSIEVASISTLRRILGLFIARWKMEFFVCHVSFCYKGYFGSVCQSEV